MTNDYSTAEYIVLNEFSTRRQGSEVARITASTYKWGPGNAMEKFVIEQHPEPGAYIVVGPGSPISTMAWCRYVVAYPEFTIEGTRDGGVQIYGRQEDA